MIEKILESVRVVDRLTAKRYAQSGGRCNIISVGEHDPKIWGGEGKREWIPLSDSFQIVPEHYLQAITVLQELCSEDSDVIVCCHAGESRSPAVVVGWLIVYHRSFVRSLPAFNSVVDALPSLFVESHRWVYDGKAARADKLPKDLLSDPTLPDILSCYAALAVHHHRIYINIGLWCTLLRAGVFAES